MQSKRLDFLIRRNKGKAKLSAYKQFFNGFNLKDVEYIDLEKSDQILNDNGDVFITIDRECEMVDETSTETPQLIRDIFNKSSDDDHCFIFTCDVYECGMFKANTKSALDACLKIAFQDFEHSCYVIDNRLTYYLNISYYDEFANEDKNSFDIQRKQVTV